MGFLDGIVGKIRQGADDVGSFFSGQPSAQDTSLPSYQNQTMQENQGEQQLAAAQQQARQGVMSHQITPQQAYGQTLNAAPAYTPTAQSTLQQNGILPSATLGIVKGIASTTPQSILSGAAQYGGGLLQQVKPLSGVGRAIEGAGTKFQNSKYGDTSGLASMAGNRTAFGIGNTGGQVLGSAPYFGLGAPAAVATNAITPAAQQYEAAKAGGSSNGKALETAGAVGTIAGLSSYLPFHQVTSRLTGSLAGDLASSVATNVGVNAVNSATGSLAAKQTYNPNLTWQQAGSDLAHSAAQGVGMGLFLGVGHELAQNAPEGINAIKEGVPAAATAIASRTESAEASALRDTNATLQQKWENTDDVNSRKQISQQISQNNQEIRNISQRGSVSNPFYKAPEDVNATGENGIVPNGNMGEKLSSDNSLPPSGDAFKVASATTEGDKPFVVTKETRPSNPDTPVMQKGFTVTDGKMVAAERIKPTADKMNADSYSNVFGVPKDQYAKDIAPKANSNERNVAAEDAAINTLKRGGLKEDAIQAYQDEAGGSRTSASIGVTRAAQEANQALRPNASAPNEIVKKLPEVAPGDYEQARINPQIVDNGIKNAGKEAIYNYKQLTSDEKNNFWHSVEDPSIPRSPEMEKAISSWLRTSDTVHAFDTELGGQTRHIVNYGVHGELDLNDPEQMAKYEQIMKEKGITDTEPNPYNGYHNQPRVFGSRAEAEAAGFNYVPKSPLDEISDYVNSSSNALKKQALIDGAAKADAGMGDATKSLDIGMVKGKPTNLSLTEEGAKQLKGYANPVDVGTLHQVYRDASRAAKADILGASGYHHANVDVMQAFPSLMNHPILAAKGLFDSTVGLFSDKYTHNLMEKNLDSGLLDKAARMGTPIRSGSDFSTDGSMKIAGKGNVFEKRTFDNAIALMHSRLVEGAVADFESKGISLDSARAHDMGRAIDHTMGMSNQEIQNLRPGFQRALSDLAFAPQFTRSKWAMWKDLASGNEASAQAARAIVGKYVMGVALSATIGALAGQKTDSLKDMLLRNLVHPGIQTNMDDGKGGKVELSLPSNYVSEAAGLIASLKRGDDGRLSIKPSSPSQDLSNVANYGRSRLNIVPSTVLKVASNKQFNGQPIYDPNVSVGQKGIQIGTNVANSLLPIPLQGLGASEIGNKVVSGISPTAANALKIGAVKGNAVISGLASSLAMTPRTDKTQGDSQRTTQFIDQRNDLLSKLKNGQWSQIDPSLKDVDPKTGQQFFDSYNGLHPTKVKDFATGEVMPKEWNALSNEQKASYFLRNDPTTGAQELSPEYYIDKTLSQQDPSRPHSPLFDLTGNGVGFTLDDNKNIVGTQNMPKAQIALTYNNQNASSDQKALILSANPWLSDYEKQVGNQSQNYQQQMSDYLSKNGWSQPNIDQYFQQHPNGQVPITPPTLSPGTQSLMDQYSAITDPTEKQKFFADNTAELAQAFKADAVYKNQKAVAQGALPLQTRPEPNANVTQLLTQLQKNPNHDKAISVANAQLISKNPELNQYLADSGLYGTAKDLAKYQFQDPSQPGLTASQLINLGRPIDQATLKGVSNLGAYDIGKNAAGQYSFMKDGTFPDGTKANGSGGKGGSGGHEKLRVRRIRVIKPHVRHIKAHRPPPVKFFSDNAGKPAGSFKIAKARNSAVFKV